MYNIFRLLLSNRILFLYARILFCVRFLFGKYAILCDLPIDFFYFDGLVGILGKKSQKS